MVLHVQYHDNKYDYVIHTTLDELIDTQRIKRFYRPSEERWITPDLDPVRGIGGHYLGPERRHTRLGSA
jgi:hypothetical protein